MKLGIAVAAVLVWSGLAFAQQPPDPQLFSSDLVAWSSMQEPQQPEQQPGHQQPTPDPNPETQSAQNPTPSQPSTPGAPDTASQNQEPTAQTFTGTVSKDADNFVLKVSDTTSYKLDNQQQVQQYQGQHVRVTGTLERSLNLIHVDRIEPLS